MALIVLFSANGSPGVSTSALGLAMAWPRPSILADTDTTGARAVAAGYFHGGQLPTDASIVDLAIAHRQGTLVEDLPRMLMRIPNTHIQLLNGPVRHNQARSLDSVWEPLAGVFKSLERNGQDVIVDAGRLGLEGSPYKLLAAADLALLEIRRDYTMVIVTHNMGQAQRVAEHTAFFLQGELVEFDTTAALFGQPRDSRTADYIAGRFG